jgi:hypothetical protein
MRRLYSVKWLWTMEWEGRGRKRPWHILSCYLCVCPQWLRNISRCPLSGKDSNLRFPEYDTEVLYLCETFRGIPITRSIVTLAWNGYRHLQGLHFQNDEEKPVRRHLFNKHCYGTWCLCSISLVLKSYYFKLNFLRTERRWSDDQ